MMHNDEIIHVIPQGKRIKTFTATLESQAASTVRFIIEPGLSDLYFQTVIQQPMPGFPMPGGFALRVKVEDAHGKVLMPETRIRSASVVVGGIDPYLAHHIVLTGPGSIVRKVLGVSVWSPRILVRIAGMSAGRDFTLGYNWPHP